MIVTIIDKECFVMPDAAYNSDDIQQVTHGLESSLRLLRHSYIEDAKGSGWYHHLKSDKPGPTATALGIMAFQDAGEQFEAITFLRNRQVHSDNPLLSGGWATNTSSSVPVMESTGWVARCLGMALKDFRFTSKDLESARTWIVQQQNKDGGWASFVGNRSRVWQTCLALRALHETDVDNVVKKKAIDWLLVQQDIKTHGWGEYGGQPPTVAHTAFVLLTLSEVAPKLHDSRISKASVWLRDVMLSSLENDDQFVHIERHNTAATVDGKDLLWDTVMTHYGLPLALSALLRQDVAPHTIWAITNKVLRTQLKNGCWPSYQPGSPLSMWSVWPYIQALSDVRRWAITIAFIAR